MRDIYGVPGVKLEEISISGDTVRCSVVVDGTHVGSISFLKYYEPAVKVIGPYVAAWAGSSLCVIDRVHGTMHCLDRGDETHDVHSFESMWIIEGELNVYLFDPRAEKTLATYYHSEVITSSSVADSLGHVHDFAGATVTLDARHELQVIGRGSTKSDARSQ